MTGAPRHVVSTSFSVFYSVVAVFLSVELYRMHLARANLRGYKAAYNYLTILWAVLRAVFWVAFVLDARLPRAAFFALFWLPLTVQYATFALLATFLLKVAGFAARAERALALRAFWGAGAASLAFTLSTAGLAAFVDEALFSRVELLGNAALSLALGAVYAVLAVKVRGVAPAELARVLAATPAVVSGVTVTVALVFLSRAVYNACAFAGVATINIDQDDIETDLAAVVVYGVWEFFPLVLLLSTLAAAPRSATRGRGDDAPTFGVFGAIQALEDDAASGSEPARSELLLGSGGGGDDDGANSDVFGGSDGGAVPAPAPMAAAFASLLGGDKRASSGALRASGASSSMLRSSAGGSSGLIRGGSPSTNSLGHSASATNLAGGGGGGAGFALGGGGLGISGGLLARGHFSLNGGGGGGGPFSSPGARRGPARGAGFGVAEDEDDAVGISLNASPTR